tara:strand:- start:1004 stop:1117 length:114 start_codon:yes stop_codon:yes gene_type:complete
MWVGPGGVLAKYAARGQAIKEGKRLKRRERKGLKGLR